MACYRCKSTEEIPVEGNLLKYPGKKWLKHTLLWGESELRAFLPETELFSQSTFTDLIERHTIVFLKPDLGMKGQGVMKVSHVGDQYIIRTDLNIYRHRNLNSAVQKLEQLIGTKRYIVQQGINLIQIQGNPIDFRVLLHLGSNGEWRFFGIMGKVAAPNRFITNFSSGGKPIQLYRALSNKFGITRKESLEWRKKIKILSLIIANAMKRHFPNITELGLDIAIDNDQRILLLEANTKPQYQLFKYHENPLLYSQIADSVHALRN